MKTPITIVALLMAMNLFAQNTHNLVPNPSFEQLDKKIKGPGEIEKAEPWRSITMNQVDLYNEDSKDKNFKVPENAYGAEKARTGKGYAGISFFGYRGRMPRTYLGVKLTNPLVAGKEYCLKFHVSMSDMSKYAVNNIAMYVTKDSVAEASEANLTYTPQIVRIPNKALDKQFLWTEICDRYEAVGGEQHIIIGNFKKDDETTQESVRLSRDFRGSQERNAYYYIDDVSVIPLDVLEEGECSCNQLAGGRITVEKKEFGTDINERKNAKKTYLVNSDGSRAEESVKANKEANKAANKQTETADTETEWSLETTNIFFSENDFNPSDQEMEKIDKVASYLEDNPNVKVQIVGHINSSETTKILGKRRAFMVQKLLTDMGIPESQLSNITKKSNDPLVKGDSEKNQRVSFIKL